MSTTTTTTTTTTATTKRAAELLAIVLVTATLASCDDGGIDGGTQSQACTLIGCQSGMTVSFTRAAWPAATYAVTATLDGKDHVCTLTLPSSCDKSPSCTGDATVMIGWAGCGLGSAEQSLTSVILLKENVAKLSVSVRQDGAEVGAGQWSPTWTESRPNGPKCDPVCVQAAGVTLAL